MIKAQRPPVVVLAAVMSLALLGPGPARGGVNGTPHDMTLITGAIFNGACVYCHVPHKAQGERLWVTSAYGPSVGWGGGRSPNSATPATTRPAADTAHETW